MDAAPARSGATRARATSERTAYISWAPSQNTAIPQAHQRIYKYAKSRGVGNAQVRFYHNAADSTFRVLLDKYFACNRPARCVDLALKEQNKAMASLLKSNNSLDNMGILNLLSTS